MQAINCTTVEGGELCEVYVRTASSLNFKCSGSGGSSNGSSSTGGSGGNNSSSSNSCGGGSGGGGGGRASNGKGKSNGNGKRDSIDSSKGTGKGNTKRRDSVVSKQEAEDDADDAHQVQEVSEEFSMAVIYEDGHMAVVEKPAGV